MEMYSKEINKLTLIGNDYVYEKPDGEFRLSSKGVIEIITAYEKMKSEETIPDEYPELEGTINLCDDINNKVLLPYDEILDYLIDKMKEISQEQINKDSFQLGRYRTFKYIFHYIQSFKKD